MSVKARVPDMRVLAGWRRCPWMWMTTAGSIPFPSVSAATSATHSKTSAMFRSDEVGKEAGDGHRSR